MGMRMVVCRKTEFIGIHRVRIAVHLHQEQQAPRNDQSFIGHGADLQKGFRPPPFKKQGHHDAQGPYLPKLNAQIERENPQDNAVVP